MTRFRRPAGLLCCRLVAGPDELASHHRIRHQIFVREQQLFAESDADAHDAREDVLHVVGWCGAEPAGTVRLYPLESAEDTWQGDRLAVLPEFRAAGLGAPLVRFAVATAGQRGGVSMLAHVQVANERFFSRLGWTRQGDVELYLGRPHLLMTIDLSP
ncbi:MAG: MSMEG_0567/Sll0786 family nitrogen starvation N-acetyltransferase [Pseudonocardiaceae bacterium]